MTTSVEYHVPHFHGEQSRKKRGRKIHVSSQSPQWKWLLGILEEMSPGSFGYWNELTAVALEKRHPSNSGMAVEGVPGEDTEAAWPVPVGQRPLRGTNLGAAHRCSLPFPLNVGDMTYYLCFVALNLMTSEAQHIYSNSNSFT